MENVIRITSTTMTNDLKILISVECQSETIPNVDDLSHQQTMLLSRRFEVQFVEIVVSLYVLSVQIRVVSF